MIFLRAFKDSKNANHLLFHSKLIPSWNAQANALHLKIVTNCPTVFTMVCFKHKGVNKMSVGFLGTPSIKQLFALQDGNKFPSNLLLLA